MGVDHVISEKIGRNMFKIYINDGKQEIPKDDTFYIVSRDGIYLKKKVGIVESVAKVEGISILNDIVTYARLHIKKIPSFEFSKLVHLFKKVYREYHSECAALLYYNKNNGEYRIKTPKQEVTRTSVNYEPIPSPKNFVLLCSIHSHGNMSAFHSGTDKNDEKGFTGLHITIGDLGEENIDICASISSNNSRFPVDPMDYIDGLEKVLVEKPSLSNTFNAYKFWVSDFEDVFEKPKEEKKEYKTRYKCKVECISPDHWFKNIKNKVYQIQHINTIGGFNNNHFYLDYYRNQCNNQHNKIDYSNKFLTKDELDLLQKMDDDEDFSPCEDCIFRDCKVEMQEEELDEFPGLEIS